jgi:hypothetical protein
VKKKDLCQPVNPDQGYKIEITGKKKIKKTLKNQFLINQMYKNKKIIIKKT